MGQTLCVQLWQLKRQVKRKERRGKREKLRSQARGRQSIPFSLFRYPFFLMLPAVSSPFILRSAFYSQWGFFNLFIINALEVFDGF